MCGRYASTADPATLALEIDALNETPAETRADAPAETDSAGPAVPLVPDYNVAPTATVLTVVDRHPEPDVDPTRRVRPMRWGLVPTWAKDVRAGAKMINVRSEGAADKSAFRSSVVHRRCLVPADGWFEWRRDGEVKQPFYMSPVDGSRLWFAGLWSVWRAAVQDGRQDAPLLSCAVLTTAATGQLVDIHDRMPRLIAPADFDRWLDPDAAAPPELLNEPSPAGLVAGLELRPVSRRVGNVRNNDPELLVRVDPDEPLALL